MTKIKKLIENLEKLTGKKVVLKEACDLRCPDCGATLGKDTECDALASCGDCGRQDIYNERGDLDNLTEEELTKFKAMKAKRNKNVLSGYMRNRY